MQDSQLSRSLSHEDSPRAVQLETATVEDQGNTKKEFQYQYLAHNKLESLLVQQDFLQFANILFAKYFKNGSRKEVIQDLHSKLHAPFEPGEFASALLYQSRIALDSNKFGRRGANGSTFIALMHQYFHKLLTYKDCSDLLTFRQHLQYFVINMRCISNNTLSVRRDDNSSSQENAPLVYIQHIIDSSEARDADLFEQITIWLAGEESKRQSNSARPTSEEREQVRLLDLVYKGLADLMAQKNSPKAKRSSNSLQMTARQQSLSRIPVASSRSRSTGSSWPSRSSPRLFSDMLSGVRVPGQNHTEPTELPFVLPIKNREQAGAVGDEYIPQLPQQAQEEGERTCDDDVAGLSVLPTEFYF